MASRLVRPETPALALSASSSANSWEVVASDDDDGVDVEARPGGEDVRTPRGDPDADVRHAETMPSSSSGSSAGSAGASAEMRRLRDAMLAEATREEARRDERNRQKKRGRASARARLERARVRASARRYRDLGLCERECAALAIAAELVFSDVSAWRIPDGSLADGGSRQRSVDAEARSAAESAESATRALETQETKTRRRFRARSARVLLRGATRFAAFAAFARLGRRLRDAASFSRDAARDRNPEPPVIPGFRAEPNASGNRERLRRVLACAVVAAAAFAAAARVVGRRSAWRAAAAAAAAAASAAAAANAAAKAARVPRE